MTKKNTNMQHLRQEAAQFVAREISGSGLSKDEQRELQIWRQISADHELVYKEAKDALALTEKYATSTLLSHLSRPSSRVSNLMAECADQAAIMRGERGPVRTYKWATAMAASFVFMLASFLIYSSVTDYEQESFGQAYETAVGDQTEILLADGSVMTLNTDTKVSSAFSKQERRILVQQGEVFFNVAKDARRPFVVVVDNNTVQAVGTEFNIRYRPDEDVSVTVVEGTVAVQPSSDLLTGSYDPKTAEADQKTEPVALHAGEQINLGNTGMHKSALAKNALQRASSWRTGQIYFDGETVARIVTELQFYATKDIVIADAQVAELTAGGYFNTRDVMSFLKGLEIALPIVLDERRSSIILHYDSNAAIKVEAAAAAGTFKALPPPA